MYNSVVYLFSPIFLTIYHIDLNDECFEKSSLNERVTFTFDILHCSVYKTSFLLIEMYRLLIVLSNYLNIEIESFDMIL